MDAKTCTYCRSELNAHIQPPLIPGGVAKEYVTCENADCPTHGYTLRPQDHIDMVKRIIEAETAVQE